ncbi:MULTISPECIES: TatD family hydrolase [Petrotoga]|uniref:TatD DNase family protein n=2 Tax=Petrotoga sibirica TaxID=156202 RepID=A0A4R8EUW4_9BACT|nr:MULTISPECIES: TatD family hydrolase [Petrotoga]KUK83849.1 MAG: Hydrolase, TatD family [Petrotoga mobilis]POZ89508.1 hydrolase TatD [Petrotoga sibirica DSM 13575]POZ91850.1 hydrolase TatD [Petrotoga sp. SL27]TDX16199.1 TatD DNase family protein [Petrotoga sibirica]
MNFIDTHCHLLLKQFDEDRQEIMKKVNEELDLLIEIGINVETSKNVVDFVKNKEKIFGTVGIHPTESEGLKETDLDEIKELSRKPKIVAIGEIGLDFHWETNKQDQYKSLDTQLDIAKEVGLPVVFHIRDAYDEAYNFLQKKGLSEYKGVVHCFSSDWEKAQKFLDLGLYIGFDGPITYPKNNKLREVVEKTPVERILPETDSPFLPPVPFRGKRNKPTYVKYIYEKISEIKGIDIETLKEIIKSNVEKLFFNKV